MAAYYAGSGALDPWRITFPARGYELKFLPAAGPAAESPRQQPPALPRAGHRIRSRQALVAVGALAVSLLVLAFAYAVLFGKTGKASLPALFHRTPPRHTPSPEAKALYLRGEFYWERRTDGSLHRAIDAYTQAVVADSDYAEAYAGLAESYDLMPEYASMPQAEAFTRAMATANKAISLDPNLSIAHRALAFGLFWSQTDIPRAIDEFQQAIRLAPDDAEAHHWYANALNALLRQAEARREIDIAQQLAPASRSILADRAFIRYSAGDRQAVAQLLELEATEPDFRSPPEFLTRIDLGQGNYTAYLNQLHRLAAISKSPDDLRLSQAAQKGWNHGGNTGMLEAMRAVQEDDFAINKSDGYDLARTCALLGEKQQTVQYLQAAIAAKDFYVLDTLRRDWAPQLNGYPPFENLRTRIRTQFGIAFS
jgi:tetratricopeptide (TPR) repeat protein